MNFCTGRLPRNDKYCAALPQLSAFPLPPPVSAWSNSSLVLQALPGSSIGSLYPIDGNDTLGDCTCAAAAHQITLQNGLTGKLIVPASSAVTSLYSQLGNGQDNGLELTTVLQSWMTGILGGQKLTANCNVDVSNMNSVKQAIQYLGGLYIGFNTTNQTLNQFNNGQPWGVAGRLDGGGHCVVVTDFDDAAGMFELLTWGSIQKAEYAWWEKYVDEAHAVLTPSIAAFASDTLANIQSAMPSLS